MTTFRIAVEQDGERFQTLNDILPTGSKQLDIFFIGKCPTKESVDAGHYFQGRHGQAFWNKLRRYNVLKTKSGTFEDENWKEFNY